MNPSLSIPERSPREAARLAPAALVLLLLAACASDTIDAREWRDMNRREKVLYVRSLVGAEQVKESKGGTGREFRKPAEVYVEQIDAAYREGDQREAHEIFSELEPAR